MFKPVPIEIINSNNFSIEKHPFSIGIPCPEGGIYTREQLKLHFRDQFMPLNVTQLASWPDGSMKWVLLDFQASVEANDKSLFQLVRDTDEGRLTCDQTDSVQLVISDSGDRYTVDTGTTKFIVSKDRLSLFDQVVYDGGVMLSDSQGQVCLVDEQGSAACSIVTAVDVLGSDNTLRKIIKIKGYFQNNLDKRLADFNLKLTFFAGLSSVKCEFTLLNSNAAEHPGGVWDLGDKGSFYFNELTVKIPLDDSEGVYRPSMRLSPGTDWKLASKKKLKLEQYSSGGKNWQSDNHMNFKGEVPLKVKGFRYFEEGVEVDSGDRATPSVNIASSDRGVTAHIINFWQNFPKSIHVDKAVLSLSLFPLRASDCYELQGGERKSHAFYLDFGDNKSSLDSYIVTVTPRVPLEYYAETKVIPWLPEFKDESVTQQLIFRGVQGENNFFDKREKIDEYGWRNFGEVFADHEVLEYKGNDELISHYNNQYDPLYGFIKQYIITGDDRWRKLSSELAQHVVDIDIYHTDNDRGEYNGGLFWHTHHYLSAYTCTHRTFSCRHANDFLYGSIGGGPGAQHCYTTGLSYYYFMTGDEVYKDAALKLVDWVSRVLEGTGTLLERVFQFKSKVLPILKQLASGETVQRYKYPFTRGTGNYITSLLDAYDLTGERRYILSVERVIQQSVHPLDDISLRNLHDIESSWSYLIYLQAICKYLDLKSRLQEADEASLYAKDSLLHYVDWMVDNESPFLETPDKLEYPNHTWAAQDLRKANLFYCASLYSDDKKNKYLQSAKLYVRYVEDTLREEETRYYSRILILLMQNNMHESALDYELATILRQPSDSKDYSPAPLYSITGILVEFLMDIGSRILKLSLVSEKRWLSFRMK